MKIEKILLTFALTLLFNNHNKARSFEFKPFKNYIQMVKNKYKEYIKEKENNNEIKKYKKIWSQTKLFDAISIQNSTSEKRVAIHEAGHLVVAKILNSIVDEISIDKDKGYIIHTNPKEDFSIQILLAGFLAEKIIFGKSNNGCEEDISKATKRILKLYKIKLKAIKQIKELLQNYLDITEEIIFKNLDIIKQFADIIINKKKNKKSNVKIIYKEEINKIYKELMQRSS